MWLTRAKPADHSSNRQLLCVCFLQRPTVNQGMWRGGWASCDRPFFSSAFLLFDLYYLCTYILRVKLLCSFVFLITSMLENLESLNFSFLGLTYKQKYNCVFVCFCQSASQKCNKYRNESFSKNTFLTRVYVRVK